ncbi:unnamed protein product [Diabrotica balteata]|uniref:Uncharacterized protein n=1 Tax=Diabrotica balteata TaxID=107213 RepID=A0A9N9XA79_DIABA|nr:unnamed protein product [Diabrotica balteata]
MDQNIREEDVSSWFKGTEKTEQVMTDKEICEAIQEKESLVEILEPPPTITVKVKPDKAYNYFNTCITCISPKDIIL